MKKKFSISLLLVSVLVACAPTENLRNEKCSPAKKITIVRVFDEVVLGWMDIGSDVSVYSPTTFYHADDEHYVYLKREPYQVYYPGQVVHLPDSVCVHYAGSYSYSVGNQAEVTTLKGVLGNANVPNPEYEELRAEMYEKAKTSPWWKRRYERKFGTQ